MENDTNADTVRDAAALREALNQLRDWALLDINENAIRSDEPNYRKLVDGIAEITNAALAAPPRNCDKYGADGAAVACRKALGIAWSDIILVRKVVGWLLSPAEGGAE